jgi:hypothetical protein
VGKKKKKKEEKKKGESKGTDLDSRRDYWIVYPQFAYGTAVDSTSNRKE